MVLGYYGTLNFARQKDNFIMLQPSTFDFLSAVAENNDREWFATNRSFYDAAREDALAFTSLLISGLAKIDPQISSELNPGKCVLRIYRDVRFSKNKAPYKNNFGIWFSGGEKGITQPGYYIHLQPGASFFAAGCWMPPSLELKKIRQEIDYNSEAFHDIIENSTFSNTFIFSKADTLKKAPKTYHPDHPDITFLKLKSFEVTHLITDTEFFKKSIVEKLITSFQTVYPFVSFLRSALST